MKRVNFNKISIKNFLSFGDEPVIFEFKKGLNVVTGVNRDKSDRQNGLGKSAMMESLYFAIFGTTIRELKKDLIPNSFTKGDCEVILDFEVINQNKKETYKIVRMINPSKLYLFKEGVDITRDSIKNTEEFIHGLLSATPSIFENCVIMTLNNTIPFMAKNKIDKRKFIEGIFNLDVFSRMLTEVRENYNKCKKDYEIELTKMEDYSRTLNSLNTQKNSVLDNRKSKIVVYNQRKVDNTNEKEKLSEDLQKQDTTDLNSIKDSIKKLKEVKVKLDQNLDDLNDKRSVVRASINHNQTILPKIGVKGSSCPVCLRAVKEHDQKYIEGEKQKIVDLIQEENLKVVDLDKEIQNVKENKIKIESAIEKYSKKLNQHVINEQKKKNIKERIKQLDIWLGQLDEDIKELELLTTEFDPLITQKTLELEDVKVSVNKYRYDLNLMDTVKFIVSEDGVKSYVVKKILALFNDRIRYYLSKLDANCICNFNEYFEEEIVNEKNKTCSYFNFSGAERKNIDFACLFTFMDMRRLQGDVTYNISIYDELFDSCLDEKGINLIIDVLKERVEKNDECVLVISHRKESIQAATGDILFLEKRDGITKRINYNPFIS
jgi:chromosome segregation protein